MAASYLPDTEFKTLVIRMLKELRISELNDNLHKEKLQKKKNQSEIRNTIIEMKNAANSQLLTTTPKTKTKEN